MKVSVVTPTFGRERHLEPLVRLFRAQTHPDKELVILDDSPQPSPALSALRADDVRYIHSPQRESLGSKRNRLAREARGDVLVHFDDDDYYAPDYLSRSLEAMGDADAFTWSSWFAYDVRGKGLYYWDTTQTEAFHFRLDEREGPRPVLMRTIAGIDPEWESRQALGYGFTYLYRKSVHQSVRFDALLHHGEDYEFLKRVQASGARVKSVADHSGCVLHLLHGRNTSSSFPNYRLPAFLMDRLFGNGLREYLKNLF
jgi:glycosyltransferase involved in cell wall biosynthesis